jgi:hypothetical protein
VAQTQTAKAASGCRNPRIWALEVRRDPPPQISLSSPNYERTKCLLRFDELGVSRDVALRALRMTAESAERMEHAKTAYRDVPRDASEPSSTTGPAERERERIPLKGAMSDFRGETLTVQQQSVNKMAGGMRPAYYIELLIGLLKAGLCKRANEKVVAQLQELRALLNVKLPQANKKRSA